MRVYLPSTLTALAVVHGEGSVGPAPLTGCAVTPALRESYATADLEELEYAALTEAARLSLGLLPAEDPASHAGVGCRRVVIAAEVPEHLVSPVPGEGRAVVRVDATVPVRRVAAVHVDDAEAEADVDAAVAALPAAATGDPDAQFVVDGAEGHELGWYATQEIPSLVAHRA
jgi:hypothetical protein